MVTISKFVLLLIILVALQFKDGESEIGFFQHVHINITNKLVYQLGIKCKDKHSDYGYQVLESGQSYTFKFLPTFLRGTSLYFCSFSWINGYRYLDIYIQKRDQDCGNDCQWVVKDESGPCKIKTGSIDCFQWNPNVAIGERQLVYTHNL
jgi:hypothetical protein